MRMCLLTVSQLQLGRKIRAVVQFSNRYILIEQMLGFEQESTLPTNDVAEMLFFS